MKKFFKVILYIILVLVILVGSAALYISTRSMPHMTPEKIVVNIEYTPARLEQGTKLATMLCKDCHFNEETKKFTGGRMDEVPEFGEIYAKNITNHPNAGIGKWTDAELVYFLRTGIRRDGQYIPPYMPKLINISTEDLYSIITFLRSDNAWVQPDPSVQPETKPGFLTKFLLTIKAFEPFEFPKNEIPGPDTSNLLEFGKYITLYQLECYTCHSADFAKNDYLHPEKSKGFFGGGNEMRDADGNKISSLNITMHENGIGKWDEGEFVTAIRSGIVPDNQPAMRLPMKPYTLLTEKEAKAIYAYLKSVPLSNNVVKRKFN